MKLLKFAFLHSAEATSFWTRKLKENIDHNGWQLFSILTPATPGPFRVYSINDVVEKSKTWTIFLPDIDTYYAVKCNDDLLVLQLLAVLGTCFDCTSREEIRKVVSLGITPERIIYVNPTKPISHITYARGVGANAMTFGNENELRKIHKCFPESKLTTKGILSTPAKFIRIMDNKPK